MSRYQRYCNLGWETGEPKVLDGYELWNNVHTATLEDFKIKSMTYLSGCNKMTITIVEFNVLKVMAERY